MQVRVDSTRSGKLRLRGGVTLEKGVNNVDPEAWDKSKECPITRHFLKLGVIAVVANPVARKPSATKASDAPIKPMPVEGAKPGAPHNDATSDISGLSEVTPSPYATTAERPFAGTPDAPREETSSPPSGPTAAPVVLDLALLSTREAIAAVGGVDDVSVLEKALEQEARGRVVKALKLRIASMKGGD